MWIWLKMIHEIIDLELTPLVLTHKITQGKWGE
jgi:hypothetical protein